MTLEAFLTSLREPSVITAAVGVLLSWLAEYWPQYQTWQPKAKRLVFLALCVAVPMTATALALGFGYLTNAGFAETFWPALYAGATAFAGGTVMHARKL